MIKELIKTMRPIQWYKNLVIFVAIVFSFNLTNINMWIEVISAFGIFCLLSGSVYIINDIVDREEDRQHPQKKHRPIASGSLKVSTALIAVFIFIFISVIGGYLINFQFLIIALAYLGLNLSYSFYLKHVLLVDLMVISTGFVLRAIAGALAIQVVISPWLIICAFLLALFLGLGKRRHELVIMGDDAENHRSILEHYTKDMLEQMISITTGTLVISYSLYTFMGENRLMMITIPIVIYALFRYLFLVHAENFGGEPQMLFKDRGMLFSMIIWVILVFIILYFFPNGSSLFITT